MICPKCKTGDFSKLEVVDSKVDLTIDVYTGHQEERTLLSIKCLNCKYEFKEEV